MAANIEIRARVVDRDVLIYRAALLVASPRVDIEQDEFVSATVATEWGAFLAASSVIVRISAD